MPPEGTLQSYLLFKNRAGFEESFRLFGILGEACLPCGGANKARFRRKQRIWLRRRVMIASGGQESNLLTDASVYHQAACDNHIFNPESNGNAAAGNLQ
jgi:hypothetical protein